MIHFLYLLIFAFAVAVCFGVFSTGSSREKFIYGLKIFAQFVVVSLVVAWVFYFLPY